MATPKQTRMNLDCHRKLDIVKFSQCCPKASQQEIKICFTALWELEFLKEMQCVISWKNLIILAKY
jgi:hypothetical protein